MGRAPLRIVLPGTGAPLGAAGIASGVLVALALRVPGLGPLAAIALIPLLAGCLAGRPGRAAVEGWLCGVLVFGTGFAWVLDVRGSIEVPTTAFLLGTAFLALATAGFGAGVAHLARRSGPVAGLAAAPALWIALEWARSLGPVGVPWLRLGSSLAEWPLLIQGADLGGVFLLSGWIVALDAALVALLVLRRREALPVLAALVFVPVAYGARALDRHAPGTDGSPLRVAAVQPNIAEESRHDPALFDAHLRRLLALSESVAEQDADLVVWPETAYERPISQGDPFLGAIANLLGLPLLTGVRRFPADGSSTARNSVALAVPGGESRAVADKVHPVPVYESAPPLPTAWGLAAAGWWPGRTEGGEAPGLATIPRGDDEPVSVGVLICFDASHTDVARRLRRAGAVLLVGVYNEAQAGRWVAHQHELFARLRAVENRIPLVRVANTGRSAWIDSAGRTLSSLRADAPGAGTVSLPSAGAPSLYSRWGDAPVVALAFVVPVTCGLWPRRRPRSRLRRGGTLGPIHPPESQGDAR